MAQLVRKDLPWACLEVCCAGEIVQATSISLELLCPRTRTLPSVHEVGPCNYRMRLATGQKTSCDFLATNLAYPDLLNRKNPVVTIGAEGQR